MKLLFKSTSVLMIVWAFLNLVSGGALLFNFDLSKGIVENIKENLIIIVAFIYFLIAAMEVISCYFGFKATVDVYHTIKVITLSIGAILATAILILFADNGNVYWSNFIFMIIGPFVQLLMAIVYNSTYKPY